MKIKNDECLDGLRIFGFRLVERGEEGFVRYSRRIGNLVVSVANKQFENKIRISMLKDKYGMIRTSYHDIEAYTDLIHQLVANDLVLDDVMHVESASLHYDMSENPLVLPIQKPDGFMSL